MKHEHAYKSLVRLLKRLDAAEIHYHLSCQRDGAISVEVAVPGERWEVEFGEGGAIEVEVFRSDGEIHDGNALGKLFEFGDAT